MHGENPSVIHSFFFTRQMLPFIGVRLQRIISFSLLLCNMSNYATSRIYSNAAVPLLIIFWEIQFTVLTCIKMKMFNIVNDCSFATYPKYEAEVMSRLDMKFKLEVECCDGYYDAKLLNNKHR
jgi:hypothetical protein